MPHPQQWLEAYSACYLAPSMRPSRNARRRTPAATVAWSCIRAHVANGRTGDMGNGAVVKYMATGDMLMARVRARHMDDVTALYQLANSLSQMDVEYSATHPTDPDVTCQTYGSARLGYNTNCY